MIIYEFDLEERMNDIFKNLEYVTLIRNSLAENRAEYRKLASNLSIDFLALQTCCDTFQRNLLIDIYTYAEQLVKNFYYHLVEKDRSANLYIRNFINKKISADKFSPNVNYCEIEKNIKMELVPDFKFIIKSEREEIKIYNELVKSRHTYAHRGKYTFSDDFLTVINVEKYIGLEIKIIIEKGMDFRINYQNEFKLLIESVKNINKKISTYKTNKNKVLKKRIMQDIKILRRDCQNFQLMYSDYSLCSELLDKTRESIIEISNFDLRKTSDIFDGLSRFDNVIKDEYIFIK